LTTFVHDAGHTQIPSGSLTVLALGPEIEATLEEITGELKLL
jgi:PTH2 family peptidyl-tRNA hydrolase